MNLTTLRNLRKSNFTRNVSLLVGGTIIGQLLAIICSPLLTRLYTPDYFGILSLYLAFINIVSVASALRYELAIVSSKTVLEARYVMILSLILSVITSLVFSLGLFALIYYNLFDFNKLGYWTVWVSIPTLFFNSVFTILRYWYVKYGDFKVISKVTVFRSVFKIIIQLVFGFFSFKSLGLIMGECLSRIFGAEGMIRNLYKDTINEIKTLNFRMLKYVAKKHYRYPAFVTASSVFDITAVMLPFPLIASLFSVKEAGYFALVQRMMTLPLNVIGSGFADVFHNKMSDMKTAKQKLGSFFFKSTFTLFLLGIIPFTIIFLYGKDIFTFCFGAKWVMAGETASMVAYWMLVQFVVSPLTRIVFVLEGQRGKFIYDITALVIMVPVFVVSSNLKLPFLVTIKWLSIFNIFSYILYYLILCYLILKTDKECAV